MEQKLYNFAEATAYLRVSRTTIYRLMEDGRLPGYKVRSTWRFYEADLKACLVETTLARQIGIWEPRRVATVENGRVTSVNLELVRKM